MANAPKGLSPQDSQQLQEAGLYNPTSISGYLALKSANPELTVQEYAHVQNLQGRGSGASNPPKEQQFNANGTPLPNLTPPNLGPPTGNLPTGTTTNNPYKYVENQKKIPPHSVNQTPPVNYGDYNPNAVLNQMMSPMASSLLQSGNVANPSFMNALSSLGTTPQAKLLMSTMAKSYPNALMPSGTVTGTLMDGNNSFAQGQEISDMLASMPYAVRYGNAVPNNMSSNSALQQVYNMTQGTTAKQGSTVPQNPTQNGSTTGGGPGGSSTLGG